MILGCSDDADTEAAKCAPTGALTDDDFSRNGVTYSVHQIDYHQGSSALRFNLDKAIPDSLKNELTLVVGSQKFAWADGSLGTGAVTNNDTIAFSASITGWSNGAQFQLSLEVPSPPPDDPNPDPNGGATVTASCEPCTVGYGGEVRLTAEATGLVAGRTTYQWTAPKGSLTDAAKATARWRAPNEMGRVAIRVRVSDGSASASAVVHVDVDPTAAPALPLGGALLLGLLLAWRGAVRVRRRNVWQA